VSASDQLTRRSFLGRTTLSAVAGLAVHQLPSAASAMAPGGNPPYAIAAYTRPFDKFDLLTALDMIVEAGFHSVGLMTSRSPDPSKRGMYFPINLQLKTEDVEKIAAEVRQRRLQVLSVFGVFDVGKTVDDTVQHLHTLIDYCAIVGARNLLIGGTDQKREETYYQAVKEACPYAAEKAMEIAIKPHGGSNATGQECRKLIAKVGQKNFRLYYDPGNIFFYSGGQLDPARDSAMVDGIVSGLIIKDFRLPKDVMVNPGEGKVDFRAVLANLKQGGFTSGPIILETLAPGDRARLAAEARAAHAFMQALIAQ
jgi:sugar phosphate isomerase/epimerase